MSNILEEKNTLEIKNKVAFIEFLYSSQSESEKITESSKNKISELLKSMQGIQIDYDVLVKFVTLEPELRQSNPNKIEFTADTRNQLKKIKPRKTKTIMDVVTFVAIFCLMSLIPLIILNAPYNYLLGIGFLIPVIYGLVENKRNNVRYIKYKTK